ncbi:MAG: sugar kinase [Cypionkella sp.]|jgi:2-dehydro-3-deoxygluconokinase
MRMVFVGECMVELAPEAGLYRRGFAGDTFNMAWYARKLAPLWQVDYLSAIGNDAVSDEMADFIAAAGIGTTHLARKPSRSVGLYMISLQNGERSFSYWRSQSAARLLAEDPAALAAGFADADLIALSGITLAILDAPGRDALALALQAAQAQGARVAFDPNIRPRLWTSAEEMRATLTRFAGLSDLVLASFDDEAAHFGDATPEASLARYLTAGAAEVVVKNGAAPMLAWLAGAEHRLAAPQVAKIIDTTAAGDSFNAGFLVQWLAGASAQAALAAGAALAARVIQHPGALAPEALS